MSWKVDPADPEQRAFWNQEGSITCDILQTPGMSEERATKKVLDQIATDISPSEGPVHRDPNLAVRGVLLYHVHTKQEDVLFRDEFGTVTDRTLIGIRCDSSIGLVSRRGALKQINQFMATFRLR